ncbi:hypothetical protein B0T24DRAFT_635575 [Lasiosphaeria ovina]|uniref:Uncharacterized protein n=1 Tax=Lasiosphaeria ovina TaxID=92902 RepID=A0AAE0K099_9PEZI|nr:hypothetical protein B0T24DRAFT_635575 [Lasiosphaeria ovina]
MSSSSSSPPCLGRLRSSLPMRPMSSFKRRRSWSRASTSSSIFCRCLTRSRWSDAIRSSCLSRTSSSAAISPRCLISAFLSVFTRRYRFWCRSRSSATTPSSFFCSLRRSSCRTSSRKCSLVRRLCSLPNFSCSSACFFRAFSSFSSWLWALARPAPAAACAVLPSSRAATFLSSPSKPACISTSAAAADASPFLPVDILRRGPRTCVNAGRGYV